MKRIINNIMIGVAMAMGFGKYGNPKQDLKDSSLKNLRWSTPSEHFGKRKKVVLATFLDGSKKLTLLKSALKTGKMKSFEFYVKPPKGSLG